MVTAGNHGSLNKNYWGESDLGSNTDSPETEMKVEPISSQERPIRSFRTWMYHRYHIDHFRWLQFIHKCLTRSHFVFVCEAKSCGLECFICGFGLVFKKLVLERWGDWRDGSVVKNTCCSCMWPGFRSQQPHRVVTTAYNSNARTLMPYSGLQRPVCK